jgi:hypothetical protein
MTRETLREKLLSAPATPGPFRRRKFNPTRFPCSNNLCDRRFKSSNARDVHERTMHEEAENVAEPSDPRRRVHHPHLTG